MINVYYYMKKEIAKEALKYGIKLSEFRNRIINIPNVGEKKCILALLNPSDDTKKCQNNYFACLKLNVRKDITYIADKYLFQFAEKNEELMVKYLKSIVPIKEYIFGSYRYPEVLITTSILEDEIKILNQYIDSPILVESSEPLYLDKTLDYFIDNNEDFYNDAMFYYLKNMTEKGLYTQYLINGMTLFVNNKTNENIVLNTPDFREEIIK